MHPSSSNPGKYVAIFTMNRTLFRFICIISIIMVYLCFGSNIFKMESMRESFANMITFKKRTLSFTSPRCVVYVNSCEGRLGNKMFIIASAYGLSRLHACHLSISSSLIKAMKKTFVLNFSPYFISATALQDMLKDTSKLLTKIDKYVVCQYYPELVKPNAICKGCVFELKGYWQSYLHFVKYSEDLREHVFLPVWSIVNKVSKYYDELCWENFRVTANLPKNNYIELKKKLMQINDTKWIGVHVRRTDFVELRYSSSDQYLFAAFNYFTDLYSNVRFIVASDDKQYCQDLFKNRSDVFITPLSFSEGEDLVALSLCEYSIITAGSYGWWSSYLTNGHALHDGNYPSGCLKREQYWPPWFLILNENSTKKNNSMNQTFRSGNV